MKNVYSKQFKTYKSLIAMLEENKAQWQNFQPMVDTIDEINSLFQQSELLREATGVSSVGKTIVKNNIKKELLFKIRVLRNAIIAYAAKEEKHDLLTEIKNKGKLLKINARETSLLDSSKYIYSIADMLKNELLDYKINQTLLDDTIKQIDKFKDSIATPISIIRAKKLNNEKLERIHKKISRLLIYRLDNLIKVMELDSPDLAAKYFILRPYPKIGTRKKIVNNNNNK